MPKVSVKNLIRFLLSPKDRIKRLPYLFGVLLTTTISYGLTIGTAKFIDEIQNPIVVILILIFVIIIIAWPFWILHIKRLHDVNLSGWISLIFLIPFINFFFFLFLLFKKSIEPNKQKNSSAENRKLQRLNLKIQTRE